MKEKRARIVIRRVSQSGQHGYLSKSNEREPYVFREWTVDPKQAHRFESMLAAMKAAALLDLDEGYDYVWMR